MKYALILVAILGTLFLTQGTLLAQRDLRPELEKAFGAYYSALAAGDAEKFKRSLPAFRYMRMRNQAISQGEKFPESFFEEVKSQGGFGIDLKILKHIKTVPGGNVAYMVYFGEESIYTGSDQTVPKQLVPVITSLLFVKEGGQWKFCEAEQAYLRKEDLRVAPAKLADKGAPNFRGSEGVLSGKLPSVPREYPTPDYIGSIVINAENCRVTVKYNAETESLEHASFAGPLIGGLKRGKNVVSINVERLTIKRSRVLNARGTPHAEVKVVVYADRGTPLAQVFHFETNGLGEVRKEFEVTDEVITKGKQ
jgi:hypothetical protein